jgi:hypothetical protein
MAVLFDGKGNKLAAGDVITMAPNHYGIRRGTHGKIVRCLASGSVQVELSTERGTETRVVLPTTVRKA